MVRLFPQEWRRPSAVRIHPLFLSALALCLSVSLSQPESAAAQDKAVLQVGFGETDITPDVKARTVYLAGFGHNRKATSVHDPLKARAIVLHDGKSKIALVSVDVVGLFLPTVERVRKQLPDFTYVLVSSTHNHEGPDTLGLWGPNPFQSGIDAGYQRRLEKQLVRAVRQAEQHLTDATTRWGSVAAPELLHDGRLPKVLHEELVTLDFHDAKTGQRRGLVVQWNCHPETLGAGNTEISADFVAGTVSYLQEKLKCPVVYLTGTVGGLMTSLHVPVADAEGRALKDGTWAKTERYGQLVGQAAVQTLQKSQPLTLTPMRVRTRRIFLPLDNTVYLLGWQLGVLSRQAYHWQGDSRQARPVRGKVSAKERLCVQTEIGWLKLGQLEIAAIPGEIYPELVLDKVQDPVDTGADFPKAEIEPAIYKQMSTPYRMLIGLANDELGYIIPKRQWDVRPPFCYGRKSSQYGEINSLGPETAPLLCEAFRQLLREAE